MQAQALQIIVKCKNILFFKDDEVENNETQEEKLEDMTISLVCFMITIFLSNCIYLLKSA